MSKDGLGSVTSEQLASEKLANKFDVSKQFVLAFVLYIFVVVLSVRFSSLFSLGLARLEVLALLEDLLELMPTLLKQLLAEIALGHVLGSRWHAL